MSIFSYLSAIHYAAIQGKVEIVRILLEKAQSMFHDGALHLALFEANDKFNIFHYSLIRYGVTVDVVRKKKTEEKNKTETENEEENENESEEVIVNETPDCLKYKEIFNILVNYLLLNRDLISVKENNKNQKEESSQNKENPEGNSNLNDNSNADSNLNDDLSDNERFVYQELHSILDNKRFIDMVRNRKLVMPDICKKVVDDLLKEHEEEEEEQQQQQRPQIVFDLNQFHNNPAMMRAILPQLMQLAGQNPQMMPFVNQLMQLFANNDNNEEEEEEEWKENDQKQDDQQDENDQNLDDHQDENENNEEN